jgi:hypothetical protein
MTAIYLKDVVIVAAAVVSIVLISRRIQKEIQH